MSLTPSQIKEITEELEMGLTCHIHKKSLELVFLPDVDGGYFEAEMWQEQLDKITTSPQDYEEIEPMSSHDQFLVMEEFADNLPDQDFRMRVLRALNRKSPFRNFKYLIGDSEYLDDWYKAKNQASEDWVKKQIRILSLDT